MTKVYVDGKRRFQYRYSALLINPLMIPSKWFRKQEGYVTLLEPAPMGSSVVIVSEG